MSVQFMGVVGKECTGTICRKKTKEAERMTKRGDRTGAMAEKRRRNWRERDVALSG